MRVVMVSKALVVGAYQRKAEALAARGVELTVLVPACWRDRRGTQVLERAHTRGYTLRTVPLVWNGSYHLHFYPTLARELARLRPQVVHMDEEPYNLATWLGVRAAQRVGARPLFFTWQNLRRRYPPPFRWFERAVHRACPVAIAGSQEAAQVLAAKGYPGIVRVIPQFGVDPAQFTPASSPREVPPFRIGYAGGLVPEKGVALLLRACAGLGVDWQLVLAGEGGEARSLKALAQELGISSRVRWLGRLSSLEMPDFYRSLHVLVLPSRTRRNWKEQFGRVLVEAMACGVPVVGSRSGEIPHVIGQAGWTFPEGDVEALRRCLERLAGDPALRARLARQGRERVLAHFTMAQVADRTVEVYRLLLSDLPTAHLSQDRPGCVSP